MSSLRIGRREQTTTPSALRRQLGLEEGGHLIAHLRDGETVLRPAGRSIFALRGSVPVDRSQNFASIWEAAVSERVRRVTGDTD